MTRVAITASITSVTVFTMEDKQKTLAAITIIVGVVVLIIVIIGAFVSGKKIVSPVPEEGAIKIIFITPTPTVIPTPATTSSPTPTKKVTPKPTIKPTATPTSTKSATPTP